MIGSRFVDCGFGDLFVGARPAVSVVGTLLCQFSGPLEVLPDEVAARTLRPAAARSAVAAPLAHPCPVATVRDRLSLRRERLFGVGVRFERALDGPGSDRLEVVGGVVAGGALRERGGDALVAG